MNAGSRERQRKEREMSIKENLKVRNDRGRKK